MKSQFLFILCLSLISCLGKKASYKPLIEKQDFGSSYVITNVDVFNGMDSVLFLDQSVFIKDGMIVSISDRPDIPKGIDIIDGSGRYLSPGFIDTHVHIMASGSAPWEMVRPNIEHNLEAWLAAGVTTVYDLGGIASQSKKYKGRVEKGEIPGPNIYYTGSPITAKDGHPIAASKALLPFPLSLFVGFIIETADEKTDVSELISDYQDDEVDYIKIINDQLPEGIPQIENSVMKAIIDESHENGLKTFVHIGNANDMISAIEAGTDVLAHFPYRGKLSNEIAARAKESGIKIIHTLTGFENTYQISNGSYQPSPMDAKMQPGELLNPVMGNKGLELNETEIMDQFSETLIENRDNWKNTFHLLQTHHISFAIGTDSPLPGSYAGSGFHEEMKTLKKMGYSDFEILRAATSEGAKLFLDNPNFGLIQKGNKADLLILNKNPLESIAHSSDIDLVVKNGVIYKPTY
ncbi:MAG: amidohydrolase family protein [Cyclobacteriaceae bacterium]